MSLLHSLEHLLGLGQHQQAPQSHPAQGNLQAHSAPQQQLGNNSPAAQLYASNPQDPRVMHQDPAQFGYPADNSGAHLQVGHSANYGGVPMQLLMGASNMPQIPQGSQFNPGLIPMQGSRGFGAHPQIGAFGGVQRPGDQRNPQQSGSSWNNY